MWFECLLVSKFPSGINYNLYVQSTAKEVQKMVGSHISLQGSSRHILPCLTLTRIRPCPKWSVAVIFMLKLINSHFSASDRVKKLFTWSCGRWHIFNFVTSSWQTQRSKTIATLSPFPGQMSVSSVSSDVYCKTRLATSTEWNHPHLPRVPCVRRKFHTNCIFPSTWNWLSPGTLIVTSSVKIRSLSILLILIIHTFYHLLINSYFTFLS